MWINSTLALLMFLPLLGYTLVALLACGARQIQLAR